MPILILGHESNKLTAILCKQICSILVFFVGKTSTHRHASIFSEFSNHEINSDTQYLARLL